MWAELRQGACLHAAPILWPPRAGGCLRKTHRPDWTGMVQICCPELDMGVVFFGCVLSGEPLLIAWFYREPRGNPFWTSQGDSPSDETTLITFLKKNRQSHVSLSDLLAGKCSASFEASLEASAHSPGLGGSREFREAPPVPPPPQFLLQQVREMLI